MTTKLPDYILELKELEKDATPQPWQICGEENDGIQSVGALDEFNNPLNIVYGSIPYEQSGIEAVEDLNLIIRVRNIIPRLLEDYEAMVEALDKIEGAVWSVGEDRNFIIRHHKQTAREVLEKIRRKDGG